MRRRTRTTSKHNDLVVQLNRVNIKRDKMVAALARIDAKRLSLIRAIARSQKRLAKAATASLVNAPIEVFNEPEELIPPVTAPQDDLTIPAMLQRPVIDHRSEAAKAADRDRLLKLNEADEKAKAEILAEQAETKKKKASARIAKLKVKQSGDARKMPLQGKAALEHINKL